MNEDLPTAPAPESPETASESPWPTTTMAPAPGTAAAVAPAPAPVSTTFTDEHGQDVEVPPELQFGQAGEEVPIPFTINGEVFKAVSEINADDYGKLTSLLTAANQIGASADKDKDDPDAEIARANKQLELVSDMMELFLTTESIERMAERLKSKERPIGPVRLMEVVNAFLPRYMPSADKEKTGDRPTPPTSD